MTTNNQLWSPEETEKLRILWTTAQHIDAGEIAQKLGRPRNSVLGHIFRMRQREGAERWPNRAHSYKWARPRKEKAYRPKHQLKQPKPEPKLVVEKQPEPPKPEKVITPPLPDQVIARPSSSCVWEGCMERKTRGSYCADHAKIVYLPREARR